ncbi:MAG: hypothetical protein M3R65_00455 [Gemmatimonadota bacterium]|nr:hypothetical protein [Gemmatimonadota bacterium]
MPKTDVWFDPSRYATVAERIALFYGSHPEGRIQTELITRDATSVTFKALVYRGEADAVPAATGWATEREGDGDINTVACLENTETSAIGRALANLGFTAAKERPSLEEMRKAARSRNKRGLAPNTRDTGAITGDDTPENHEAFSDLLDLLSQAEQAGLAPQRADLLRERIERGPALLPARISELERSLRNWLHRREDVTGFRLSP